MKKILFVMFIFAVTIAFFSCNGKNNTTTTTLKDTPIYTPIDNHEHSYIAVVTDPNCIEQGYTTYTCECGDSYVDDYVDTLDHNFGEWITVIKATLTKEGLQERTCICGEKQTQTIDKLKASEGLEFTLNDDGASYSLTGIGTCIDEKLIIPNTYNSLPVTVIVNEAFIVFDVVDSSTIVLRELPFKEIVIPDSVLCIEDGVFSFSFLTNIEVDDDNQYYSSIDGNLYTKDGKTLIRYAIGKNDIFFEIPTSVKKIGDGAFLFSISLENIIISDSVTIIGDGAFAYCTSLINVLIPDSVTSIGETAFSYCSSLKNIALPNCLTYIDSGLFEGCSSLSSIVIPISVRIIDNYAFRYCSSLTSVKIPDSVTSVGCDAFNGCTSLTIYCEATSQPSGWDAVWNSSDRPVVWGYKGE